MREKWWKSGGKAGEKVWGKEGGVNVEKRRKGGLKREMWKFYIFNRKVFQIDLHTIKTEVKWEFSKFYT